ncbi:hypothetical protein EB093_03595 [bacterium]|nr:hypothetical protein [bacterium]
MISAVKTSNPIASVLPPQSASVSDSSGKFKQLFNEALTQSAQIQQSHAAGVVEELSPEMASQFFSQIIPEDEFNPTIDKFDRKGQPLVTPAQKTSVSDWTLAQAPAQPVPGAGKPPTPPTGVDPNRQALDETLQRPFGQPVTESGAGSAPRLGITPFQFFIDKAVDFFLKVSDLERKSDLKMVDFAQGRASLEEVMVEKAKVSVALSFSVTLVNQVTQSFKEIQNMQV